MTDTICAVPAMPTVKTSHTHYRADLRHVRAAILEWLTTNYTDGSGHDFSFNGNEIYWVSAVGPVDGLVDSGTEPGLSVAMRYGGNEGVILTICANLRESYQGGARRNAYVPIFALKVWTTEAGAALGAAVMRAAVEMFQPEQAPWRRGG